MNPPDLHIHVLKGCAPLPLAHYLKGLAVLRLITEQAPDPEARGAWRQGQFVLLSRLSREALEQFFLEQYAPSPLLDPWNKGSGFFQKEDKGLDPIEKSKAPRFEPLRRGIRQARTLLERLQAEYPGKGIEVFKSQYQLAYRNELRGDAQAWINAALVFNEEAEAKYPALLGTGGNDGRLDFCNNFMQRLSSLFQLSTPEGGPHPGTSALLSAALFAEASPGLSKKAAIGQFLPGGAGGANSTHGPDGDSLLNPWDYVLMMEGALLFSPAATRRLGLSRMSQVSAPFSLSAHATGYAGASVQEEDKSRGEQWMPLWENPLSLEELRLLLVEGRAQVGSKPAERPLDAARAIARLGVARGLTGFQRYGYLERNGQAKLAVPLGLIAVRERPRARLIDDLSDWLDKLRRTARDKGAPTRLQSAERALSDAVFSALTHEDQPDRWQRVLRAAVEIERIQSTGSGIAAGPIPALRMEWLEACDDGSRAFRLAVSLASARALSLSEKGDTLTLRSFFMPLDRFGNYKLADKKLMRDPRVVCFGRSGIDDAIALQLRLDLEAAQKGHRHRVLDAPPGLGARLSDVAALLEGHVSLDDVFELARGLMPLRWWEHGSTGYRLATAREPSQVPPAWCALKLNFSPMPAESKRTSSASPAEAAPASTSGKPPKALYANPAVLRRLQSGDLPAALALCLDRQRVLGGVPTLHSAALDPTQGPLWAAALLFPIHADDLRPFFRRLDLSSVTSDARNL